MENASLSKLFSFASLPRGWNYGNGTSPDTLMLEKSAAFLNFLSAIGFQETDVFPGTDGEILVRAYHDEHCLGFLFELNGTISLSYENAGKDEHCPETVTIDQAQNFAIATRVKILNRSWDISASHTLNTSITEPAALPNLPSRRLVSMGARRLSSVNVLTSRSGQYVSISNITTQRSEAIPQSSAA